MYQSMYQPPSLSSSSSLSLCLSLYIYLLIGHLLRSIYPYRHFTFFVPLLCLFIILLLSSLLFIRTVTILPPNSSGLDNKSAIYAVQLDSDSNVCPSDYFLIYLTTESEIRTDEENSKICTDKESSGSNGSVERNIDSVWDQFVSDNSERLCGEMDRAMLLLTAATTSLSSSSASASASSSSSPTSTVTDDVGPNSRIRSKILCSATTIRPLYRTSILKNLDQHSVTPIPPKIVFCGDTSSSITMENEVEQAKEIFHSLFPGVDFLPPILENGNETENENEN